jgi:hypothetical protein
MSIIGELVKYQKKLAQGIDKKEKEKVIEEISAMINEASQTITVLVLEKPSAYDKK